ncbi:MAG: hypothetical protein KOO62_11025 [candidate division Zixibacteria bacterium]|nr:hypothetical protein [candidate division Zixibacteria bacterium]
MNQKRDNFKMVPTLVVGMLILAVVVILAFGCDNSTKSSGTQTTAVMVGHSGCGDPAMIVRLGFPLDQDCVVYEYDGNGTLLLTHYNAGFNCCTDLAADINISNNVITITETESGDYCHCLCLYDVDYAVNDLPAGEYTVKFVGLYQPPGDDTLSVSLVFDTAMSGEYCVDRSTYPWSVDINPTGALTDSSQCKDYAVRKQAYDTLADKTCFQWSYDSHTLTLWHFNAVLNCCPVFVADVSIEGGDIVIEEIDSLFNGGCDCICPFDMKFEIINLAVGEYTITFLEPYLTPGNDTLRHTINLYFEPEGMFCVSRPNLPFPN